MADPVWGFEVNESVPVEKPGQPVVVRFKITKDGVWQRDIDNQEVKIPQENLLGLSAVQKVEYIRDRIQDKLMDIVSPMVQEFKGFETLRGWKCGLTDKTSEVPDFSKVQEVKPDIL